MLIYVNLNQRYPELMGRKLAGERVTAMDLGEITLGDWFRLGRERAERTTAVAGVFHDRIVTVFHADFDYESGYDSTTERYTLAPSWHGPSGADNLAGLLGQYMNWGRGNPSFKDADEWPRCESGDSESRMLELLTQSAEGTTHPGVARPQEGDPLLSRVTVARNPRGGIVVSVPAGTNVLIQNSDNSVS